MFKQGHVPLKRVMLIFLKLHWYLKCSTDTDSTDCKNLAFILIFFFFALFLVLFLRIKIFPNRWEEPNKLHKK